jgi:uncharacterized protein with von Willebrand factor type A (vWA) domain
MRGMLAALVDELRNVGIPVSVGEHLDAASAVSRISLQDKDVLRATLQCALIKNAEHLSPFNLIFDLYTSGAPRPGEGPLAGLSDAELRAALRGLISSDEGILRSLLADEYVRRFAGVEPGRPVAGVMYNIAVNEAADLDGIRAELLTDGLAGGGRQRRGREQWRRQRRGRDGGRDPVGGGGRPRPAGPGGGGPRHREVPRRDPVGGAAHARR